MTRRWHPEMGGSPMPLTSAERYAQIGRDLNLCGCEWCEGHPAPRQEEDIMTDYAIAREGLNDTLEAIDQQTAARRRARLAEIERTPKATLARIHVANGGQMGLSTYLKWSKDELVRIVAEDEGIDPWSA